MINKHDKDVIDGMSYEQLFYLSGALHLLAIQCFRAKQANIITKQ